MIQSLQLDLMIKRLLVSCMILWGVNTTTAQDYHFTDFRMAPSFINPALTGAFQGTYRINGIYRDQWRSFGESNPYKTAVLSADFNVKADLLLDNDWIAGGLSLLNDVAGTGGYKTTITGFQVGYHLGLDKNYRRVVSIGVNYGSGNVSSQGVTRSSDLANESSQPSYSQSGGSFIPSNFQSSTNGGGGVKGTELSIGATFKTESKDGSIMRLGLTLNHINRRDATGIGVNTGPIDPMDPNPVPEPVPRGTKLDPIFSNFILYGEGSTLLSKKVRLNPAVLFMNAGGHTQLQFQSTADYLLDAKQRISLTGGLGMRMIPFDAAYLLGGIKMKDLTVRLSYDLTLSSLKAIGGGNGFEISVGYIGRIYKDATSDKVIFCPRL